MINEVKTISLKDHLKVHYIQSEKFKTDMIAINLLRPLNARETTYGNLLAKVLVRATENYPKTTLLSQKMDGLYGMHHSVETVKSGEKIQLQFKIIYPRSKAIPENLLSEGFEMATEIFKRPYLVDGAFDPDMVEVERQNLIEDIESKINDKGTYAMERSVEILCANEPYRHYGYGDLEVLSEITPATLYDYYLEVIHQSRIDVVLVGNLDYQQALDKVEQLFKDDILTPVQVDEELFPEFSESPIEVEEVMNVTQAKLVAVYRTNVKHSDDLYWPLQMFNVIFGGSATSRIFNVIRERESLCYAIGARLERLKGIILVMAGIDAVHKSRVLELLNEIIEDICENGVTEDELNTAKELSIASLKGLSDYPHSFASFYYNQYVLGEPHDPEVLIEKVQAVTVQSVSEAAKRVKLQVIYMLKGGESNE